ncbi:tetratricopeptide repeat protein [Clostridium sp.]|jgi:tetratricopeptide (TPR) repeat protein|uniref:tetratricopeptide repeat protein n=1 Tax=Clostridium sp. TaxID=1506 RepID=UPI0039F45F9A
MARAYFLKGDIKNSKKYIQLAKNVGIKDDEIVNKIVFYEFINGDGSQALQDGEKALKTEPKNKSLIKSMMAIYMVNKELDKAKEIVQLYDVDKNSAYDLAEYSRMLMILGDIKGAFTKLKEAWNIDKDEYKIYDVLAQESLYNSDKIIGYIKELEKSNSNELVYKMWLAKIYSLKEDKSKEGIQIVEQLKGKDVGNIEIKLIEASILQNMNKNKEVDKLINEVIQNNKDDYGVLHTVAWFYLRRHDSEKAMEYCKKSIEQNKDYPDNYAFLMPQILKNMDKASLGKTYFITAMEKELYNYNVLESVGKFYWDVEKNSDKALEYYNMANNINPVEPEIKYNIALLHFNEGRDEDAIKILKECIKLKDNVIKYHRTLGVVYLTNGRHDEGIKEVRTAFKLNENDILTLNNAGCYYAIYTNDLLRAYYNLQKAADGITSNTDEYTKSVIKKNYNEIKLVIDKIEKGKPNDSIKIPDLRLLY